mmetsp:Transcript_5922/g.10656  ORF Transcript_5922/g.10656 Transcript_5922/m.10656 type:complete len:448 (+) Transcript_5922:69-1412(+)
MLPQGALRASTHLHNAGGHQLLDLSHYLWMLQVLLCCLGIFLEVLQHLPDDRVRQNALDLRIRHPARLSLLKFLLAQLPAARGTELLHAALQPLFQLHALRVVRKAQLVRLHRLGVLLGQKLRVRLAAVPLGKVRLELNAAVGILLRLRQSAQLGVAGGAVGEEFVTFFVHAGGAARDGLSVTLDGLRELLLLEEVVSLLLLLVAQLHVDVLLLLLLLQRALRLIQPLQRLRVPVLQQRVLVNVNRRLHVALGSQCITLPSHRPSNQLVVRKKLAPALDGLLARLNALIELLHLIKHGRLVGKEADVSVVQVQRSVIALDGRVKFLFLVVIVTLRLMFQRLLLPPLFRLLLLIHRLRLWLGLRLGRLGWWRCAGRLLATHSLCSCLVTAHHLHPEPHRQRRHHARVLHVGGERGGVGLDVLQHRHKVRLLQEPARLGVHCQLGDKVR